MVIGYLTETEPTIWTKDNYPCFRSYGELRVARTLLNYNIPFYYEEPVKVNFCGKENIWHPDFLLPTFNYLLVEFAGIKNDPDYEAKLYNKICAYEQDGIPLAIIRPYEMDDYGWRAVIIAKLAAAAREAAGPRYLGWHEKKTTLEGILWASDKEPRYYLDLVYERF
jgi:hypothetical protein